jgi:hypothetical protein
MGVPQGNSLCSCFKQTKLSIFFLLIFFYTKSENRRVEQVLHGGLVSVGGGRRWEMVKEGEYVASTVCTYM